MQMTFLEQDNLSKSRMMCLAAVTAYMTAMTFLERDKLSKSWMMSVFSSGEQRAEEASIKLFLLTLMFLFS